MIMQTKKEDIEKTILDSAKEAFLIHGYEEASMRMIAKKANTSLGNIYHYFPNKKAILDRMIQPTVQEVCQFIREHAAYSSPFTKMKEINEVLDQIDFEEPHMKALLSKEFVIFMETKDTEYTVLREETLLIFRQHIAGHMHFDDADNHFVVIVTKMLIECVMHMIKCNECVQIKRQEMIDMFKMMCRSVALTDCAEVMEEEKQQLINHK